MRRRLLFHIFLSRHHALPTKISYGFGILEAMIGVLLFSIGLVGVLHLLQVTQKQKQTFEGQMHASMLASHAIERLMALGSGSNIWSVEGFVTKNCAGVAAIHMASCTQGMQSRQIFEEKLQKTGEFRQNSAANNALPSININFSHQDNRCNAPIFMTVKYANETNNINTGPYTIHYNIPVYQYFIDAAGIASLGLTCAV